MYQQNDSVYYDKSSKRSVLFIRIRIDELSNIIYSKYILIMCYYNTLIIGFIYKYNVKKHICVSPIIYVIVNLKFLKRKNIYFTMKFSLAC